MKEGFNKENFVTHLNKLYYYEIIEKWARYEKRLFLLRGQQTLSTNKVMKKKRYQINMIKEVLKKREREQIDEILENKHYPMEYED